MSLSSAEPYPHNLLSVTVRPENLLDVGYGGTQVYHFPDSMPELAPYVLRIANPRWFPTLLAQCTALTPIRKIIADMHIGQALMNLDGNSDVTIHVRQPGVSLTRLQSSAGRSFQASSRSKLLATLAVMDHVLNLSATSGVGNPFLPLLQKAQSLDASGFKTDFNAGNIFLNPISGTLELVDQTELHARPGEVPLEIATERLHNLFTVYDPIDHDLQHYYRENHDRIIGLINRARAQVMQQKAQPLAFVEVTDTRAVSLQGPQEMGSAAHLLAKRLNELAGQARIPGYTR